ncbi:MAG: protein-disulfide reductase DsbD domain-containing protein [Solirubrobacterales bacterium]
MNDPGSITVEAVAARRGSQTEVILTARIPEGIHIESHQPPEPFLIPTAVEVQGLEGATVDYPDPIRKDLGVSDVVLSVYEGTPRFVVRGRVAPGAERVRGAIRYQPCVGGACLPPRETTWDIPLAAGPD